MIIKDSEHLQDELAGITNGIGLSGAELGRRLDLGRSQGNNLLQGRSATSFERYVKWSRVVGKRLLIALLAEKEMPLLSGILQRCIGLDRERLLIVFRFIAILDRSDEEGFNIWRIQINAHHEASTITQVEDQTA